MYKYGFYSGYHTTANSEYSFFLPNAVCKSSATLTAITTQNFISGVTYSSPNLDVEPLHRPVKPCQR